MRVSESANGYIHVDTRPELARWSYDLEGRQVKFNPPIST